MAEIIIIDPNGGPSSTVRCALNNTARGTDSTVSGGNNNSATANGSTVSGGFTNTAANCCSTIAGGSLNLAGAEYSFIGSGRLNTTDDSYSIVVGGENNFAGCECSFVGGGQFNSSTYQFSNVVGGLCNLAGADHGSILGGFNNSVIGACSSILGGDNNTAFSDSTVIGGGACNQSYSTYGSIGGGSGNKIYLDGATVVGGQNNTAIQYNSTVVGGFGNFVDGACSLAGGNSNTVSGNTSFVFSTNSNLTANNSVIIGGYGIFGDMDNTVYVPQLNISSIGTGTTINNLGIDSDGFVVVGTDLTGLTPTLSQVLSVGDQTNGNNIVMSVGDRILSSNGQSVVSVDNSGLGGAINLIVSDSASTIESAHNQKNNQLTLNVVDTMTLDQSGIAVFVDRIQLTTPFDGSNAVFINGFNYGESGLSTTDSTPTVIYTLPLTAMPNGIAQVNVWCNGIDVTRTSGITQELQSSYITDGISITEIGTGATAPYTATNFGGLVYADLTYTSTDILVTVYGPPSDTVDWTCRVRWSV